MTGVRGIDDGRDTPRAAYSMRIYTGYPDHIFIVPHIKDGRAPAAHRRLFTAPRVQEKESAECLP
jgi:hypothetical protein